MPHLEEVVSKEMTRKEFITTLGFGIASILGFSTVLKFVFGKGRAHNNSSASSSRGYGSNAYGQ